MRHLYERIKKTLGLFFVINVLLFTYLSFVVLNNNAVLISFKNVSNDIQRDIKGKLLDINKLQNKSIKPYNEIDIESIGIFNYITFKSGIFDIDLPYSVIAIYRGLGFKTASYITISKDNYKYEVKNHHDSIEYFSIELNDLNITKKNDKLTNTLMIEQISKLIISTISPIATYNFMVYNNEPLYVSNMKSIFKFKYNQDDFYNIAQFNEHLIQHKLIPNIKFLNEFINTIKLEFKCDYTDAQSTLLKLINEEEYDTYSFLIEKYMGLASQENNTSVKSILQQYKTKISKSNYLYLEGKYIFDHNTSMTVEKYREAIKHNPQSNKIYLSLYELLFNEKEYVLLKKYLDSFELMYKNSNHKISQVEYINYLVYKAVYKYKIENNKKEALQILNAIYMKMPRDYFINKQLLKIYKETNISKFHNHIDLLINYFKDESWIYKLMAEFETEKTKKYNLLKQAYQLNQYDIDLYLAMLDNDITLAYKEKNVRLDKQFKKNPECKKIENKISFYEKEKNNLTIDFNITNSLSNKTINHIFKYDSYLNVKYDAPQEFDKIIKSFLDEPLNSLFKVLNIDYINNRNFKKILETRYSIENNNSYVVQLAQQIKKKYDQELLSDNLIMAYLYRIGIGFEKNDILASSYMNRVNSYLLNNLKNKKSITINNQNYLINKKYLTNQNEHILVYMDMLHSMILNNDVNTSLSEEILLLANEGKFDAMIAVSSSYIKQKKFIKAKKYLQELMLKFNDINATKQLILYYAIKNNNVSEFIKLNEKILDIKGIYKMKKILLNDIKNCVKKYSLHQCYFSEQLYKVKNYDDGTIENIVADKYFDLYFENHQYANLENAIKLYNKSLQKGRKLNNIFLAYLYTYNDYVAKNSELALNYLMQLDFNIIKNNHLFQELYIINVINNLIENKQNVNKLEKTYAIHKENFTKLLRLMEKDNNPNYYFLRYKIYINELFNKKKTLARKQLLNGIKNGHYLLYNNLYWHDKTFLTYPSSKKLDNDFINHSKQYNLNDSITLNTLGHIYKDREDYKKAYESFYESLSIDSIYWLAKMNLSGLGVKKNILEALKYYDLSAKLGNINSMANLCRKYSFGYKSHIPINLKLAKFYYNLAKKFGITDKELQVYGCDFTNLKEEKRK